MLRCVPGKQFINRKNVITDGITCGTLCHINSNINTIIMLMNIAADISAELLTEAGNYDVNTGHSTLAPMTPHTCSFAPLPSLQPVLAYQPHQPTYLSTCSNCFQLEFYSSGHKV